MTFLPGPGWSWSPAAATSFDGKRDEASFGVKLHDFCAYCEVIADGLER